MRCIAAEEGPRTETFCNPVNLMLCYKLNTLPVHNSRTMIKIAMEVRMYVIQKQSQSQNCTAQTNQTPVCQGCGRGVLERAGELSD